MCNSIYYILLSLAVSARPDCLREVIIRSKHAIKQPIVVNSNKIISNKYPGTCLSKQTWLPTHPKSTRVLIKFFLEKHPPHRLCFSTLKLDPPLFGRMKIIKGLSQTLADPLRSHWVYSAATNAAEHRDLLGD